MAGPRSIFEEVGETSAGGRRAPQGGMIDKGKSGAARHLVRAWLIGLFVLVTIMVLVGGATRLTDSGLSITEWNLVFGTLPPLSEAHWQSEFDLYKQTPEFRLQNSYMDLEAFKVIYWWEWGHRLLGRVIGLVWIAGFLGFWLSRRIPAASKRPLLLIGVLIGVQGAVGWWMVSSGLTGDRVDVASYRLATHLGLAFVILGLIWWSVLKLGRSEAALLQARRSRDAKGFGLATGLLHLSFLQILLGALVAGIDAGRSFVDWPWMAGQVFPPDAFSIEPVWRNFFENPGLVQFMHRITGYVLALFAVVVLIRARRMANPRTRLAFTLAGLAVIGQMVLGIVTVLQAAPLHTALSHQGGAMVVFALVLWARFNAGYPAQISVRG